jgi:hypothetical protein
VPVSVGLKFIGIITDAKESGQGKVSRAAGFARRQSRVRRKSRTRPFSSFVVRLFRFRYLSLYLYLYRSLYPSRSRSRYRYLYLSSFSFFLKAVPPREKEE